jgi:hypothetical protein
MDKVLIRDVCFAHGESSCHERKPENFMWTREDFGSDVCFYTDYVLSRVVNSTYKKNIGWLIEPPSINPNGYKQAVELKDKFDLIFTYSQELINSDPEKFKWYPHSGCWINDSDIKIHDKSNLLSIIASNKTMTSGHKLRHDVIKEFGSSMDVFGRGIKDLPYKLDGLSSYMFSIVIENIKYDDYFTEKIIDCFASGTIPIYWGTNSVKNFFNEDGIIFFNTIEELGDILYNLKEDDYFNRMDAIKYNLNNSKEFILAEDWIFKNYPNCF